jgi:multiple sugar transport system substrate-binding protein
MTLRVALVGGPMYDPLYGMFGPGEVDVVVHADHPTLNRRVAEILGAGGRLDLVSTHSKYAPSQVEWLQPLDELVDASTVAALAPRAVELCRFEGIAWCMPRLIDVRVLWLRTDRVDPIPNTWDEIVESGVVFGFPGRESGLFGTFFELVIGEGGQLFDSSVNATIDTPESRRAIHTLCRLAARAPADLPLWHYDQVDKALLEGRIDAAGVWPGGWGAIRDGLLSDRLFPCAYPAGRSRRVTYAGCHAWAIPRTCGDLEGALSLLDRLLGPDAQGLDAAGGTICAHRAVLAGMEPASELDRRRLDITMTMIDEAMITYPPLVRFTEIEDAGWRAIQSALLGVRSPGDAARAIQEAADRVLL